MIIKVVYIIGLVAIGLGTLFFSLSGFFGDSPALGVVTIILGPLVGLLYLCFFRMMCEFYLAITRMSEDIHKLGARVALLVPNSRLAYLSRLAFGGGDHRVFYNDLAAAITWLAAG